MDIGVMFAGFLIQSRTYKDNLKYFSILILLLPLQMVTQNLVLNPSFEKTMSCAENASKFDSNVERWTTPTLGTSDLFNACSANENGIPKNFIGNQTAKFGENYAGFYLYSEENYREYIQGHFKEPLERGKKYKVSFYISLADKSDFALKKIDFLLTKNMILTSFWTEISERKIMHLITNSLSYNEVKSDHYYDNSDQWVYVSKEIIARGGETFITIGNFEDNSSTRKKRVSKGRNYKMSYYYIDMVAIELLDKPVHTEVVHVKQQPLLIKEEVDTVQVSKPTVIELDKNYVFQNVNFEFNSVVLSEQAKEELEIIYKFLDSNKDTEITIMGHTDNIGTSDFNNTLSENRAKSVAHYLAELGLEALRIHAVGFGNAQPVATNKTEAERKQNRRVEFKISMFKK